MVGGKKLPAIAIDLTANPYPFRDMTFPGDSDEEFFTWEGF